MDAQLQNDPNVGLLSVEEIVKQDVEKHFKGTGVTLQQARMALYQLAKTPGVDIARLRNTLIVLMPEENGNKRRREVHTITADAPELYLSMVLRFVLALAEKTETKELYTFVAHKAAYKRFKELFGEKFVKLKKDGERDRMDVDIAGLYEFAKKRSKQ